MGGKNMSLQKISMPQLGESVTEGTVSNWLVKEGDYIEKYDAIAEVMTDKVNAEVPSTFSGTIKEIIASEGETIAVGELMYYIETSAEESITKEATNDTNQPEASSETESTSMKQRYSPAVMRLS